MLYDIEVRHQHGAGDFFQPYIETVDALTSSDAISRVQRKNPNCLVRCFRSYEEPTDAVSEAVSMTGWITIGGLIFGLWLLVEFWYVVIPLTVLLVSLMIWERNKE